MQTKVWKPIALFFAIMLLTGMFATLPPPVFAEEPFVCYIGETGYTTLQEAIAEVPPGADEEPTVITVPSYLVVTDAVTITNKNIVFDISSDLMFNAPTAPCLAVIGGNVSYTGRGSLVVSGLRATDGASCAISSARNYVSFITGPHAVYAEGAGTKVTVNGDVRFDGTNGQYFYGIFAVDGAEVVTTGNIYPMGYGYSVYADGATVTVGGSMRLTGYFSFAWGVFAVEGANVRVQGNISYSANGVEARDNGTHVFVNGNVSSQGDALTLYRGSSAEVMGNVESSGGNKTAVCASGNQAYPTIAKVHGEVSANSTNGIAVEVGYGTVTVEGKISGATFARFDLQYDRSPYDYDEPTGRPGYYTYRNSDETSILYYNMLAKLPAPFTVYVGDAHSYEGFFAGISTTIELSIRRTYTYISGEWFFYITKAGESSPLLNPVGITITDAHHLLQFDPMALDMGMYDVYGYQDAGDVAYLANFEVQDSGLCSLESIYLYGGALSMSLHADIDHALGTVTFISDVECDFVNDYYTFEIEGSAGSTLYLNGNYDEPFVDYSWNEELQAVRVVSKNGLVTRDYVISFSKPPQDILDLYSVHINHLFSDYQYRTIFGDVNTSTKTVTFYTLGESLLDPEAVYVEFRLNPTAKYNDGYGYITSTDITGSGYVVVDFTSGLAHLTIYSPDESLSDTYQLIISEDAPTVLEGQLVVHGKVIGNESITIYDAGKQKIGDVMIGGDGYFAFVLPEALAYDVVYIGRNTQIGALLNASKDGFYSEDYYPLYVNESAANNTVHFIYLDGLYIVGNVMDNATKNPVPSANIRYNSMFDMGHTNAYGRFDIKYSSQWVDKPSNFTVVHDNYQRANFTIDKAADLIEAIMRDGLIDVPTVFLNPVESSESFTGMMSASASDTQRSKPVEITVIYTNTSSSSMDADLLVTLSDGVEFVPGSASKVEAVIAGNVLSFSQDDMAVDSTRSIRFWVVAPEDYEEGYFTVNAKVNGMEIAMLDILLNDITVDVPHEIGISGSNSAAFTITGQAMSVADSYILVTVTDSQGNTVATSPSEISIVPGKSMSFKSDDVYLINVQVGEVYTVSAVLKDSEENVLATAAKNTKVVDKAVRITKVEINYGHGAVDLEPQGVNSGFVSANMFVDASLYNSTDLTIKTTLENISDIKSMYYSVHTNFGIYKSKGVHEVPPGSDSGMMEAAYTSGSFRGSGPASVRLNFLKNNGEEFYIVVAKIYLLIDPSGYVYDLYTGERVAEAEAVLQYWDGDSEPGLFDEDLWIDWEANDYEQNNNQITDDDGRYGWFVPEGYYRVLVTKDGYHEYNTQKDPKYGIIEVLPPRDDINIALVPKLVSISIPSLPEETEYVQGDTLDLRGLIVHGAYGNGVVSTIVGYTTSPVDGSKLEEAGTILVTVNYTENDITETVTFSIVVGATAHVHDYTSTVTAPTCTKDGYTTYNCHCGEDSYTKDDITALGHDYKDVVTAAPTCIAKGVTTYTCERCEDSYTQDDIPALGHDYKGVVTAAPTCIAKGVTTYTCERCEDSYTQDDIPALGHDYSSIVTAPTCMEDGYTTYTCSACGNRYSANPTDALGHKYIAVVTAPTCTEQGYTTFTCSVCKDSYIGEYTDPIAHNYITIVTAPTCTEIGYTTYTCDCGYSYTDANIPALGHDFSILIDFKEETPLEDGYYTYQCSRCDETDTVVIPATGVTNEYTVRFDVDGSITRVTVIEGEKVIRPLEPQKTGFIFTGWYIDGEAFDFETPITKDITLTAGWMEDGFANDYADISGLLAALEKADPYLANYRNYTRSSFNTLNTAVEKGIALSERYAATPMPVSSQAELDAAATAINNAVKNLKTASLLERIANSILNFIDSHRARIVRAVQISRERMAAFLTCDISFYVDGNVMTHRVYRNRTATKPATPVKDGYTFNGWRVGSDSGALYNFNAPVRRDLNLYASWIVTP